MKIEHIKTFNWVNAMRGARNPLESWEKNDTGLFAVSNRPVIGKNDLDLAKRLIKAGESHRKFLRQIFVSMDITAPMYWWSEMDTYKIGTTANSTSKMHKLASTPITINCFETDDMVEDLTFNNITPINVAWEDLINACEALRKCYNETKDPRYWKELIRILPESWLQTRTWTGNYEVLRNIYQQRKNHKLVEWHTFCNTLEKELPYAKDFIIDN